MKSKLVFSILSLILGLWAQSAAAASRVERYALVAGANSGGSDRPQLKYAVSDARSFARVLVTLGGVEPANALLLEQPSVGELDDALDELRSKVSEGRRAGHGVGRSEVLVYYSGHADEKGLLLGEDRYSYGTLRARMEEISADVRLAVLDACASGAITRLKGGQQRKPFLVDASSDMRGHAFLTSSSADEAAQESDRIGGSFFTYYLISGLRGAADVSGEGKVTFNEAYQFAFAETLGDTVDSRAGAQHPAYDINLSGTGDVVMTDLRQTSAGLVLGGTLAGRCFVRNAEHQLVVELAKPRGRRIELGLEPGEYEIRCQEQASAFLSKASLADGTQVVLEPRDFTPTERIETVSRGGLDRYPPIGQLNGRHRAELRFSYWGQSSDPAGAGAGTVTNRVGVDSLSLGGGYSYWIKPELALGVAATTLAADVSSTVGGGISSEVSSVVSLLVSVRRDFLGSQPRLRPYATAGIGPYLGSGTFSRSTASGVVNETKTMTAFGGYLGGGLDVQLNRFLMVGGRVGFNLMSDFSSPVAGKDNFSGFEAGISIGFLFGKGTRSPE